MSDSDSDDEKELKSNVELGFLEKSPSWKLESRFFPNKVGFKPAWLELCGNIPSSSDVLCEICNKSLVFLCQVYAPIVEKESCFHRTLFVFICRSETCIKKNSNTGFKVFRNQLSRTNNYYPFDPPIEEENWRLDLSAELFGIKLCNVCGLRSTNHCGNCKTTFYCSREHQVLDWKSGHKEICNKNYNQDQISNKKYQKFLFPEYEIVTEPECDIIDENEEEIKNDLMLPQKEGSLQGVQCEDLAKMALSEEDKCFMKFRNQIKYAPDQVIRYERKGRPLWVTDNCIPDVDVKVPNCQYCSGKRCYEFQILPQLLNYLELNESENSLDWGTLLIFTCENSCGKGPAYKEEYLLKQDMINSDKNESS